MECIRRICCLKKQNTNDTSSSDDEEFIPVQIINAKDDMEPVRDINTKGSSEKEPESFFRSSVLSIYKKVDSVYKQASEWSLPNIKHVNLFTLSAEDLEEYEEDDFFDDVVDEKF